MITRTEQTAWTVGQWNAFLAAYGDFSVEVNVQRYGPDWSPHPGEGKSGNTGTLFDAIQAAGYLVRCWADADTGEMSDVSRLASEAAATQAWEDITVNIAIDVDVPPSLAVSGTAVRLFYYDGTSIKYIECADITAVGPTFGAAQTVGAVSDLVFLAATSTTKVYYGVETAKHNRRLYSTEFAAGWTATASDIYWPFVVYSFDAVAMDDYDLVVMATMLPPLIDSRVIGSELQNVPEIVQGLVTFRVANGRFSDHEEFDVIDKVDTSPARTNVRLNKENGIVMMAYQRRGGTGDYTYTKPAVSRSMDGRAWEFPEFLEGGLSDFDTPMVILPRADYLYAAGVNVTQRSNPCAWAGQTPEEKDITQYIRTFQLPGGEISQVQLGCENPEGVLDSTLLAECKRTQVQCNLGWVVAGVARRLQISTTDVEQWTDNTRLAHIALGISAKDRMARINRIKSDFAAEWGSMQAGRDQFVDTTGTGYGGTRFVATLEGSVVAEDGELSIKSYNKEVIAVSTFVNDALNGSVQTGIKLNYADQGEYGGVVFRLFDKSNFCAAVWRPDTPEVALFQREGQDDNSSDTGLDTGNPGFGVGDINYLKVVTHYGMVYTYYSGTGIDWSLLLSTEMPGQADPAVDYPVLSGRFGLIGYGYSDEDTAPSWEPTPWPVPLPPPPGPPKTVYLLVEDSAGVNKRQRIYRTETWGNVNPIWVNVTENLVTPPFDYIVGVPIKEIRIDQERKYVYLLHSTNGIYRASTETATPVWSLFFEPGDSPTTTFTFTSFNILLDGHLCMRGTTLIGAFNYPRLVIISPSGSVEELDRNPVFNGAAPLCNVHNRGGTMMNGSGVGASDGKFFSSASFWVGTVKCLHIMAASPGEGSYTLTDEIQAVDDHMPNFITPIIGMEAGIIGHGAEGAHTGLYAITPGDPGWDGTPPPEWNDPGDISPADWAAVGATVTLERDDLIPFAILNSGSKIYSSMGSQFVEVITAAELGVAAFTHCAGYAGDPSTLFVVGTDSKVMWTRTSGATWESKVGTGIAMGSEDQPKHIRAVWGDPEDE